MAITASLVKELRDRTGAGMMECKKSLVETDGDIEAAIEHMRDWALGTSGKTVSMGIHSDGSYGVEEGLIYSFPVTCDGGEYSIVQGLEINDFSQDLMNKTEEELKGERDAVASLLP